MLASLDLEQIHRTHSREQQLEQLVINPARKIKWLSRVVLVLDALDECGDRQALKDLVQLARDLLRLPPAFTIFLCCRPVDVVEDFVEEVSAELHSLDDTDADAKEDIRIVVRSSLSRIKNKSRSAMWPPEVSKMDEFADACGGLFEIASVRIRQVRNADNLSLIKIFEIILSYPNDPAPSLLKEYRRILKCAYIDRLMSEERIRSDEPAYKQYRKLVGVLITTLEPMSPLGLSNLVNVEVDGICDSLKQLSPVLEIRGDDDPFRFYHASFREYLLSNDEDTASVSYPISFNGPQHFETLDQSLRNFRQSNYGKNRWTAHLELITDKEALHVSSILRPFLENDLIDWLESMNNLDASRQCITPMYLQILSFHAFPQGSSRRRRSGVRQVHAFTWNLMHPLTYFTGTQCDRQRTCNPASERCQ